jgi:hypothetical protein
MDRGRSRSACLAAAILSAALAITAPAHAATKIGDGKAAAAVPSTQNLLQRCPPKIIAKCAKGLKPVCVEHDGPCCARLACRDKPPAEGK